MNNAKSWVESIGRSIDAKDAKGFSEFITETGSFRFGNQPEVRAEKPLKIMSPHFSV